MPRRTKFSKLWLERKTADGQIVSSWCEKCDDDEYVAYCTLCRKRFLISNGGFAQIESHANGCKHKSFHAARSGQSFFTTVPKDSQDVNSTSEVPAATLTLQLATNSKKWVPATVTEKVIRAEGIILLTAIKCNYSFSSINELGKGIVAAFDDSEVSQKIKLSDAKARYVTKFGLAPYFLKRVFSDFKSSKTFFSLYFDETSTKQVKKQLDVYIGYWSEKYERIQTSYCDSFFLGHADADKILEKILSFVSENDLQLDHLLQFSMDGPKVNLSFQKKINTHLATLGIEPLVNIGTCSLHIVHNALKKATSELNVDVEDFVLAIFQWFKMSAARREDYHEVQDKLFLDKVSQHFFLRHVENRWLTLGPVCERVIEQFEVLKEYFLVFLPKTKFKPTEKYTTICDFLKDSNTLLYLNFVVFLSNLLSPYLLIFQNEGPLVHILYTKQNEVLRNIMLKFIKSDVVGQKEGLSLLNIKCQNADNWIPVKKIDVGCATKQLLKFPEHKDFLHNIRNCFIKLCEYLQKNLPLSNPLLADIKYITPHYLDNKFKEAVSRIAEQMTKLQKSPDFCDKINSEYNMLICEDLSKEKEMYARDHNICKYWSEIAKKKDALGTTKYPNISRLVKTCLTLSHGNSIPERGFSINRNIVTDERNSISEVGIKSLRICKDYLRNYNSVSDAINKELINSMQKARAEYASYLENMKTEKEREILKRKLEQEEEENILKKKAKEDMQDKMLKLTNTEDELLKEQKVSYTLLNDATQKLETAVKKNDFNAVKVAQMMLNVANSSITDISDKLAAVKKEITNLQQKM